MATRRSFLAQTSVGAAALALVPSVPAVAAVTASSEVATSESSVAPLSGPMIAHVKDVATGDIALLVGTREISFRDPHLVARLVKAARRM